mgnify:FL=1
MDHLADKQWIKHWAGRWSILTSSYLGEQYTETLKETLGESLELSLFVSKEGFTVCSLEKNDHYRFGSLMAKRLIQDETNVTKWCTKLKSKTDDVLFLIKSLENKIITKKDYDQFIKAMLAYGSPHRAVKISVDFLPQDILDKHLATLTEARVYAEPAYEQTEKFMKLFASQIADQIGLSSELILSMTKEEFEEFLISGQLPEVSVLEKRHKYTAIVFTKGKFELLSKEEFQVKNKDTKVLTNEVKGTTAYPGIVRGRVRVIFDPHPNAKFEHGDILVTGMTRPEYAHLIEKSAGFITDAGGVLSHAAIVAREMKKPCIVGLEFASKVFKDGDLVEIDASNGVVRKLIN